METFVGVHPLLDALVTRQVVVVENFVEIQSSLLILRVIDAGGLRDFGVQPGFMLTVSKSRIGMYIGVVLTMFSYRVTVQ